MGGGRAIPLGRLSFRLRGRKSDSERKKRSSSIAKKKLKKKEQFRYVSLDAHKSRRGGGGGGGGVVGIWRPTGRGTVVDTEQKHFLGVAEKGIFNLDVRLNDNNDFDVRLNDNVS